MVTNSIGLAHIKCSYAAIAENEYMLQTLRLALVYPKSMKGGLRMVCLE
jgi:hypothetical protein